MDDDLSAALSAREEAGAALQAAAHALTQAFVAFSSASDSLLQAIPAHAVRAGERVKAQESAKWAAEESSGVAEDNQRKHSAENAGLGARAAIEFKMCQAVSNGFRGGRPQEALGVEFSTEAGQFLRSAAEVAASRAPQTQPDGSFLATINSQHTALRDIAQQLSGV